MSWTSWIKTMMGSPPVVDLEAGPEPKVDPEPKITPRREPLPEFDPVRCAELHNKLLSKIISQSPGAEQHVKQDVLSTWLEIPPENRRTEIEEDSPLYKFLSLIQRYEPDTMPFTQEYKQPTPEWFDNNAMEEGWVRNDRTVIPLYPQHEGDYDMDYGLWFDLNTNLVIWAGWRSEWDPYGTFPPDEEWVSLELVLTKALKMWEIGKYYWGPNPGYPGFNSLANTILMCPWIPTDLQNAVHQWEILLQTIQERLPERFHKLPFQEPLPEDLVEQFKISSFAKAFLCAAKRPCFTYVAPGITTFTPESFTSIYGAEQPDSKRLQSPNDDYEGENIKSLILPVTTGPAPVPEGSCGVSHVAVGPYMTLGSEGGYRDPWMVSEWPGLYTEYWAAGLNGDSTMIVTAEGLPNTVQWEKLRPWGGYVGNLPLARMFLLWTDMVKTGEWEINSEGVSTSNNWFWDVNTQDKRRVPRSESDY